MHTLTVSMLENEFWWGGVIHHGRQMPLTATSTYAVDLAREAAGNQSSPLFVSTKGRYFHSAEPYQLTLADGIFTLEGPAPITLYQDGNTLADAYYAAMKNPYKFSEAVPEKQFFTLPQYNTWIELLYDQNQEGVLDYARKLIQYGYPPGILMIDDTWQEDYGLWQWHPGRYPDPKAMMAELKDMGFRVMLWMVPFISPDSGPFREAWRNPKRLLRYEGGAPFMLQWWNGYSAMLDMTAEEDIAWMHGQLRHLQEEYGIEGFKFDGGSLQQYQLCLGHVPGIDPARQAQGWMDIALCYPYHEMKDTWDAPGLPVVQRQRDKRHAWGDEGLADILPDALALSVTGHAYFCPDMVGGGECDDFMHGQDVDAALFVRMAQASALFPMYQLSKAPWGVLDEKHNELVRQASLLHAQFGEEIYELACQCAKTARPLLTPLCFDYPNDGYETITDQFMLGKNILVAPVLTPGNERKVVFPQGNWQDAAGNVMQGPCEKMIAADIDTLPWYRRQG